MFKTYKCYIKDDFSKCYQFLTDFQSDKWGTVTRSKQTLKRILEIINVSDSDTSFTGRQLRNQDCGGLLTPLFLGGVLLNLR